MKKITTSFILSSLLKGFSLHLIILLGKFSPASLLLLRFLLFILAICFIDWKIFSKISTAIEKWKWIILSTFSFGTFISGLFITSSIFIVHNKIFGIQAKEDVNMPSIIPVLLFGAVLSAILTTIWTKKRLKN